MESRHPGPGRDPEFRLSTESARAVAGSVPPTDSGRHFLSTDHLSTEAAAAYADGRLPHAGRVRADAHLERCPECRREVEAQRDVRRTLRGSGPIHMPSDLRDRLSSIEQHPPAAPADPPRVPGVWTRLLRRLRGDDR